MKPRALTIGYLLALLTLLGAGIIIVTQSPVPINADIRITPPFMSLEDPPPTEFRVTIKLPASSGYDPDDIDPDTILVEGIIQMKVAPDWPKTTKKFFAFNVDGASLVNWVIKPYIGHMAPLPGSKVDVPITVTGQFYDTTDFQGTAEITVHTEHASPPPPPL